VSVYHRKSKTNKGRTSLVAAAAGSLVALPLAAAGGWIAYSALGIDHDLPLPSAIDAQRLSFSGENTGQMNAYVDHQGSMRPLVLVHSINAAASAYEMRPLFEHYRGSRPIWALELPGFGFSGRADRVYTPQLYQEAILELLTNHVGQSADVVALSLGCEFVALAALARPELFHSLVFISPTGFTLREQGRSSQRASQSGLSSAAYRLLSFPVWAQALYDLIVTQRSIHFFLEQSFVGPVDQDLADYGYLAAHQPGARFAPLYFLSGRLFTPDVRQQVYARLSLPALVLYDRDAFVGFDTLPDFVKRRTNWGAVRITPSQGLPHFERLADTALALDSFWASLS
jgi:pimeloyl-ACP methyl ester carboxylesterase